jgi:pimeloyl-ACP methyl ester carboxylesterase
MSQPALPRVAVIHGGPGAAGSMAPVAVRLSEFCEVLEPYQTATSVQGQIDELSSILESLAQSPVTLVGHSWGAWLSLLTAAQSPHLISKLILVGCPPFEESSAAQINATRLSRLTESERAEFTAASEALNAPGRRDRNELLATLGRLATKADAFHLLEDEPSKAIANARIYGRVWPEAAEFRRNGELIRRVASVTCPVLSIHGDHDSSPPVVLSHFRTVVLPQCGHTPWRELHARESFFELLLAEIST